jgi:hypothetical protein
VLVSRHRIAAPVNSRKSTFALFIAGFRVAMTLKGELWPAKSGR